MIRAVLSALIQFSTATLGASADDAYQAAKSDYQKLKGDEKRRALRHHWQNVARKFEAVATRFPRSERAPEALFNAGELNNELSRFSAKDEDRESAKRSYRRLIERRSRRLRGPRARWSPAASRTDMGSARGCRRR